MCDGYVLLIVYMFVLFMFVGSFALFSYVVIDAAYYVVVRARDE